MDVDTPATLDVDSSPSQSQSQDAPKDDKVDVQPRATLQSLPREVKLEVS